MVIGNLGGGGRIGGRGFRGKLAARDAGNGGPSKYEADSTRNLSFEQACGLSFYPKTKGKKGKKGKRK